MDVDLHVGLDKPELKPVETGPLPPQTTGVARLVIEAGTIRGENRCSPLEAHEFSRGRMSRDPESREREEGDVLPRKSSESQL